MTASEWGCAAGRIVVRRRRLVPVRQQSAKLAHFERSLLFSHDPPGRNLGCANTACNLCKLSQRRRCQSNFAAKYLAPCDVVEAKCGAQVRFRLVTCALLLAQLDGAIRLLLPLPPGGRRAQQVAGACFDAAAH